ncbi:hypothetical protein OBBRIDRAFT_390956 [Obba rivulosa]|uniref:DUF6535 domain-containing protein n=1 Tax=Obba rivulosa TaxID=1052685 RepID=A0A8E2AHH6_9APHY|nr:hypothetical protein OBBRIDRAFT_390956 [Obba rivulosa]
MPNGSPSSGSMDMQTQRWAECIRTARTSDEEVTAAWKDEIDTYLTFAGLFSGVLTAFIVGVYSLPAPNGTPDVNTEILLFLAAQYSAINASTAPQYAKLLSLRTTPSQSPTALTWVSTLWYYSLILSLSAASIGITIRQWLNHFISPLPSEPISGTYVHCLRWYMGIVAWHVPETLSLIPILLLLALILFVVGLVILLWTLNSVVVVSTAPAIAALLCFIAFTTVAPIWKPRCPYKSPQALVAFRVADWAHISWHRLLQHATPAMQFVRTTTGIPISCSLESRTTPTTQTACRDWVAIEQSHVQNFFEEVILSYLRDPNRKDQESSTFWWFQRFIKDMRQPVTYASKGGIGKFTIESSPEIPDRLVCEFVTTCGEWVVRNVPLAHDSLVKLVTLANRCFSQDTSQKMVIGRLMRMILDRKELVLSLISDDWHTSGNTGPPMIDHTFVEYVVQYARLQIPRSPSPYSGISWPKPAPEHVVFAGYACSLAMQLANILPTATLHEHLRQALAEDFRKDLNNWGTTVERTTTEVASMYFEFLETRINGYASMRAVEPEDIQQKMLSDLEEAERSPASARARASRVTAILNGA